MSKTYRNPRREVLARLKALRDRLAWCANRWNVSGLVYESVEKTYTDQRTGTERTYLDSVSRRRRPEEYPENSAREWNRIYQQAREAALEASELAELAAAQWRRCMEEQQTG